MEYMSNSIGNLAAALAAAQAEMKPAKETANNPAFRSKYADLTSCFEACNAVLPKHKLSISQVMVAAPEGYVSVQTLLLHESGEWLSSVCTLKADGNRGVNAAQAAGSAITYARRYGLTAIVGLATDDDDGNAAGAPVQPQQRRQAPAPAPRQQAAPAPAPQPKQEGELDGDRLKALFARLKELGYTEKEDCLIKLSEVLGRTVNSRKDLTVAEFHKFMAATENAPVDQPPF
jgi:hypothetical protein